MPETQEVIPGAVGTSRARHFWGSLPAVARTPQPPHKQAAPRTWAHHRHPALAGGRQARQPGAHGAARVALGVEGEGGEVLDCSCMHDGQGRAGRVRRRGPALPQHSAGRQAGSSSRAGGGGAHVRQHRSTAPPAAAPRRCRSPQRPAPLPGRRIRSRPGACRAPNRAAGRAAQPRTSSGASHPAGWAQRGRTAQQWGGWRSRHVWKEPGLFSAGRREELGSF